MATVVSSAMSFSSTFFSTGDVHLLDLLLGEGRVLGRLLQGLDDDVLALRGFASGHIVAAAPSSSEA
ncbi:hypothetical protein [Streptomyces cyanogenus]|uniref:hypothetical protein n=1 Tax=Streptomyces cyanogenus TaxID=80860 RepID=UPI001AA1CDC0|nr:hypothetical protein [Streptomyces cyanogenus]